MQIPEAVSLAAEDSQDFRDVSAARLTSRSFVRHGSSPRDCDVDPVCLVRPQSREGDMTMKLNRTLWIVQVLLALVYLFSGSMKLILPVEAMQQGPMVLPG
jgi:hypothetical protein